MINQEHQPTVNGGSAQNAKHAANQAPHSTPAAASKADLMFGTCCTQEETKKADP
jgi:hypothetical protein